MFVYYLSPEFYLSEITNHGVEIKNIDDVYIEVENELTDEQLEHLSLIRKV